jgi:hypothetical protein
MQIKGSMVTVLFWPDYTVPFYRFISDPVSYPDSNPDPKCFLRFRIGFGSGRKFRILPDPQHRLLVLEMRSLIDANRGNLELKSS